jgi:thiosulfate reductase cytochrome b subunit
MSTIESARPPLDRIIPGSTNEAPISTVRLRHSLLVRTTHWINTVAFFALLLSGSEIIFSHPRFYWGETGNVLTRPLFTIHIPSSRNLVPTGYGYVLPDQNGWSRALHFQSAWVLVLMGMLYIADGVVTGHFREDLIPARADLSWRSFINVITHHLRIGPGREDAWSYNALQRLSYLFVVFILFPIVIWTGLAMSPAFDSAIPATVNLLGGRQSARTLHFFVSLALVLFVMIHIVMVWREGFKGRMRAMITGRTRLVKNVHE